MGVHSTFLPVFSKIEHFKEKKTGKIRLGVRHGLGLPGGESRRVSGIQLVNLGGR